MEYSVTVRSRPEAANDVISGIFVRNIVTDDAGVGDSLCEITCFYVKPFLSYSSRSLRELTFSKMFEYHTLSKFDTAWCTQS